MIARCHFELVKLMFPFSIDLLMQQERDRLLAEVENLAANNDGQALKLQDTHSQKLKSLEAQVCPIVPCSLYSHECHA